jgi:hypothetical protein
MCDEVLSAIKQNENLLKTNQSRYDGRFAISGDELFPDTEKHMLVHDIIYCSSVYSLFKGITFSRPKTKERQLFLEREKKAKELAEKLNAAQTQSKLLKEGEKYFNHFFKPGMQMQHKVYGDVRIDKVENGKMTICILPSNVNKDLEITSVVAYNLFSVEEEEYRLAAEKYASVFKRKDSINSALKYAEKEFEPYAEYLD